MATTTGPQYSIYLQLNGRRLTEGATRTNAAGVICEDAKEAWHSLSHGTGDCRLRCVGDNLAEVRGLYAAWLAVQRKGDEE